MTIPPSFNRRRLLGLAGACAAAGLAGCRTVDAPALAPDDPAAIALLDDLEQRTFRYFWDTSDPETGLAPDRSSNPWFASVAAAGFALTAYPVGMARGHVTRAEAAERVRRTLRFFHDAPQGPGGGTIGHRGFYYHFLDARIRARFETVELSTMDTAILVAGALYSAGCFDADDPVEADIRRLAQAIYARVEWPWMQARGALICHGWKPETGHLPGDYKGYNEAMLLYLLALGSPTHPVGVDAWEAWTRTYDRQWSTHYGYTYQHYHPLFVHQFTHCWVDLRGLPDEYMRRRGIDYFENSRRATLAQRAYAIANPARWIGYGPDVWGITACDGPADVWMEFGGRVRKFTSYGGRGMGGVQTYDDGTIAPYAAGASIVFTPEHSVRALAEMRRRHGEHIYGRYGFVCFNRSFAYEDIPLRHGRLVRGFGWVDDDYLGIEQGPLLAMLGNHRGELVWRTMRNDPHLRTGLRRAGFRGGWLE